MSRIWLKALDVLKEIWILKQPETLINPSQIKKYQDTLKYARSKVDFVYGIGLYMSPSNMELRIGEIQNYYNKIIVATDYQKLGINNDINIQSIQPTQPKEIKGTPTKKSLPEPRLIEDKKITTEHEDKKITIEHDDKKTALIVTSIVIGIAVFIFIRCGLSRTC